MRKQDTQIQQVIIVLSNGHTISMTQYTVTISNAIAAGTMTMEQFDHLLIMEQLRRRE